MYIEIEELPRDGRRLAGTTALDSPTLSAADERDVRFPEPVVYDVWAILEGIELKVRGAVETRAQVECSRCLKLHRRRLRRSFEVSYVPRDRVPRQEDVQLDADELDVDYYDGVALDLRPLLAEQLLLALPMKPLCRQDCRGLCPQCGIDLNEQSCDCEPPVDPRLADLAALRDQL